METLHACVFIAEEITGKISSQSKLVGCVCLCVCAYLEADQYAHILIIVIVH